MQPKWMILLTTLVLFSTLFAPASTAGAAQGPVQTQVPDVPPHCPPYEPGFLNEKGFMDSLPPECIRSYKETAWEANATGEDASDAQTMAVSASDEFGYTYDSTTYNWLSATTKSGLTGDDEFTGPINIGFSFPFYGIPQTQLYFNTNGLITFDAGSWKWGGYSLPNDANPNNLIAPFWDDLLVGSPYNSGAVYYSRGGSAPNRYFVVEWRNVESYNGRGSITFEAILYENGDIFIQHRYMPLSYYSTVGIEDRSGHQALLYQAGDGGLWDGKAIRFTYPSTPRARVLAYSPQPDGFAPLHGQKDFTLIVTNTGSLGTDTFDLSRPNSAWTGKYYAADGVTPLSDTDGDTQVDTGPIAQGASTTIIARYLVPAAAGVGKADTALITITSSVNTSVEKTVSLSVTVPAAFASVFVNETNGAMSLLTVSAERTDQHKVTADNYFGSNVAIAQMLNGNYFYAWNRGSSMNGSWAGNIEYVLLDQQGGVVRAAGKLTNNSSASLYTWDDSASIAVASDGTMGVIWRRYQYNDSIDRSNYNIFFATLDAAGNRLTGPTNITNNTVWGGNGATHGFRFFRPTIAATSDKRFVLGWEAYSEGWKHNIWYTLRTTSGTQALVPKALTSNNQSEDPTLNKLKGGKVIMTWRGGMYGPHYAVIDSNGSIVKPATTFAFSAGSDNDAIADAVQLPNGNVAVAWATDSDAVYHILDSSYNSKSFTSRGGNEISRGHSLSVTTDASSRVIMTWLDGESYNKQIYTMGSGQSAFLAHPIIYNVSRDGMGISWNGQGMAPYEPDPVISGTVGVARATVKYTGGSTIADSGGYYSIKVPPGWSGRVTPSKSGYIFSPAQKTYSNITASQALQNYRAIPFYSISGSIGVAGVRLNYTYGTPKTVISQPNGTYSFSVPANWSGTVTPVHDCFTFDPIDRIYFYRSANLTGQDYTPSFNSGSGCADVDVSIGGLPQGRFGLPDQGSTRASFSGLDKGPVQIVSTNAIPLIGAERVVFKVNNIPTSFSEMMALPDSQLDTIYWLPWYNNKELNTQLRFANVSDTDATVHVTIGGVEMAGSPYTLAPGASLRKSYAGIDKGPVKIESDVPIVAAERVVYNVNGVDTSFTEMMALPNSRLDTVYWLPWYNNKELDTQLRFANVSDTDATVHVYIGGVEMAGSPYTLAPGASLRKSYAGIDKGPVQIESDVPVVAAERVVYKVNGIGTSFSELMALPNSQLDTTYWLPWYNNKELDTQLRFANVSDTDATVHVFIGGVEMTGSPYTLASGASLRKSFPLIDKGPVQIVSDVPIVAAERVIYNINGDNTSFSEMMALPDKQLDMIYWLPWYNNVELNTQLRFGVP